MAEIQVKPGAGVRSQAQATGVNGRSAGPRQRTSTPALVKLLPTRYAWGSVTDELSDPGWRAAWAGVAGDRPLSDLIGSVGDALAIRPPGFVQSILGRPASWLPGQRYSEYKLLHSWRLLRAGRYVVDVAVPSVPVAAPEWLPDVLSWPLWHPSRIAQRPDHNGSWTSHSREAWFFVNGILTNADVASLNAEYLSYLFHRPLTLIENSTAGAVEDLLECALDKAFGSIGEAATKAVPPIYDALKDPDKQRVVVIAHSQGTIIASVVLRFLSLRYARRGAPAPRAGYPPTPLPDDMPLDPSDFEVLTDEELSKLELYCFANCATQMPYLKEAQGSAPPLPWIESYGNEHDIVARLGVLAPRPDRWGIHVDGPRYLHRRAWGHLLNAHYLAPVEHAQKKDRKPGPRRNDASPFVLLNAGEYPGAAVPRLYSYINGGGTA